MTSKRNVVLSYTVLSILLIASAVFLAYQIRHFMYERVDVVAPYVERMNQPVVESDGPSAEEKKTILTFAQTRSFAPLATPVPTPTARPTALPTATPVIAAKSWKLLNCLGTKYAKLQDFTGKTYMVSVGQVIENRPGNQNMDFKILEISYRPAWVKVQDITSSQVRILQEELKRPPKKR